MSLTLHPTDATLGAVITDIDLTRLKSEQWRDIEAAFLTYGALFFPAQHQWVKPLCRLNQTLAHFRVHGGEGMAG